MALAPACLCPTCGAPYTGERPRVDLNRNTFLCAAGSARIEPQHAEVLFVLADATPDIVSTERLLLALYGAGDGPVNELNALRVRVVGIRRRLRPLGWTVETVWGRGYALMPTAGGAS